MFRSSEKQCFLIANVFTYLYTYLSIHFFIFDFCICDGVNTKARGIKLVFCSINPCLIYWRWTFIQFGAKLSPSNPSNLLVSICSPQTFSVDSGDLNWGPCVNTEGALTHCTISWNRQVMMKMFFYSLFPFLFLKFLT